MELRHFQPIYMGGIWHGGSQLFPAYIWWDLALSYTLPPKSEIYIGVHQFTPSLSPTHIIEKIATGEFDLVYERFFGLREGASHPFWSREQQLEQHEQTLQPLVDMI